MPDAGSFSPTAAAARNRWRAAEDRLYPSLIMDPSAYLRVIDSVKAVVAELRKTCTGIDDILAMEAAPGELILAALPNGSSVPTDLLISVACGMADREIAADNERARREAAIEAARAAGKPWVVLTGPATIEELTEGRRSELHLTSGTVVEGSVDPWSGDDPYRVEVVAVDIAAGDAATSRSIASLAFADRDKWLAEIARRRADAENGTDSGPDAGGGRS